MDPADFYHEQLGELGELRSTTGRARPSTSRSRCCARRTGAPGRYGCPGRRGRWCGTCWRTRCGFFGEGASLAFDEQGCAELARGLLADGDELAAVMLRQEGERAFAVWRRELTRQGWSWTLDLVLVPEVLAAPLCTRMLAGLDRLDQPRRWPGASALAPSAATPSQPPSARTRSISRR